MRLFLILLITFGPVVAPKSVFILPRYQIIWMLSIVLVYTESLTGGRFFGNARAVPFLLLVPLYFALWSEWRGVSFFSHLVNSKHLLGLIGVGGLLCVILLKLLLYGDGKSTEWLFVGYCFFISFLGLLGYWFFELKLRAFNLLGIFSFLLFSCVNLGVGNQIYVLTGLIGSIALFAAQTSRHFDLSRSELFRL